MAIRVLPNQPINFEVESDDPNCGCGNKAFCQLIAPTDATQFQIGSGDTIINGNFEAGSEGWETVSTIGLTYTVFNASEGNCDGGISLQATNYTGDVSFSLNGGELISNGSPNYGVLNQCAGCGYATVQDSLGNQASIEYCITNGIICGDYTMTTDFVGVNTIDLANCYTTDFQ